MQISYEGTTIATGAQLRGAPGHAIEGVQLTTILDVADGINADPLAQGNRRRRLPLTIATFFDSQREAEEFFLEHYDDLPDTGTLTFTCGYTGDTSTREAEAILESCIPRIVSARCVVVEYIFFLGPVTTPA